MSYFDSHGTDRDRRVRLLCHVIVYAKTSDSKFPWRDGIWTHRLTILRLMSWMVRQLLLNRVDNDRTLMSRERSQMLCRIW